MNNLTVAAWFRFSLGGSASVSILLLLGIVFSTPAVATVTWEGSSGIRSIIDPNCSSCHGTIVEADVDDCSSAAGYIWYNKSTPQTRYDTALGCRTTIQRKTNYSKNTTANPGAIWGNHMPSYTGCDPFDHFGNGATTDSCLSSGNASLIQSWGGTRWAAPTTTTLAATSKTISSATLNSSTDPRGASTTITYTYSKSAPYTSGSTTTSGSAIGSGGNSANIASPRVLSGLLDCGTSYDFYVNASNNTGSVNNVSGSTLSFDTSNCTNPSVSVSGAGSSASERITVPKGGNFTQADLTFITNDDDTSIASWSFGTPTNGSISDVNASAGTFTYNAPGDADDMVSFTVTVTDSDPTSGGGANTSAAVTVFVEITDSAPEFRTAAFPDGSTTSTASLSVTEGDGVSPSQSITMFAYDVDADDTITWSIYSGPSRGGLSGLTSTAGTTNSITYTPNENVDVNDEFVIQITDGITPRLLTVTAMLTAVPDNPVANPDPEFGFYYIYDVGEPVSVDVLGNDEDVDTGDMISIDPSGFSGVRAGASVSIVSNEVQYTSPPGYAAVDTFQYQVIDDSPSMLVSNSALVTMTPRDTDVDGVPDYLDNCAASPNADQADNDNDQEINVNTTSDPGGSIGGDECDLDDDNDGMLDQWEMDNIFDPFDPSDAAEDADGDGLTNLEEHDAMSNPHFGVLTINATGFYTPYTLVPPPATSVHSQATLITPDDSGPYRPGAYTIVWTTSNASTDMLNTSDQVFNVRPLINFSANQQAVEGSTVNVKLSLNGKAPSYPVTVNYSISGTATAADYSTPTPASGAVVFNDTTPQTISFNLTAGDGADANETMVFTINSASNAAIGTKKTHTVTIVEGNVAPTAKLQFSQSVLTQGVLVLSSVYADGAAVTIDALASDQNSGQILSYNWSGSDSALFTTLPTGNSFATPTLAAGKYLVDVIVTDNGSPQGSIHVSRILNVLAGLAPDLTGVTDDSDGDSLPDNDPAEGLGDSDGDGIPNYLDAHDGNMGASNLVVDQVADVGGSFVLETEAGLTLSIGNTAQAANNGTDTFGALITDDEIASFGGSNGGASIYPADSLGHYGGIYDFTISGLIPGNSASVVIPLQGGIPRDARYRKYHASTGWNDFMEDNNNLIASASGEPGACPSPGSSAYRSGLNYLDNCLQLTIQDGGPNDTDGSENGSIADPGTIAVALTEPVVPVVEEGGGRIAPWLLFMLMIFGGYGLWRQTGAVKNRSI